jgi:hypothetical protein
LDEFLVNDDKFPVSSRDGLCDSREQQKNYYSNYLHDETCHSAKVASSSWDFSRASSESQERQSFHGSKNSSWKTIGSKHLSQASYRSGGSKHLSQASNRSVVSKHLASQTSARSIGSKHGHHDSNRRGSRPIGQIGDVDDIESIT